MTKAAALHQFFSSFDLPAYATTDVPDDAVLPYLVYEFTVGAFEDVTYPTVELYYHSESNVPINAKAQEISDRCHNGAAIHFDGGGAMVYCGPWTGLRDEVSDKIKRRRSNFTIHWVSNT